MNKEHHRSAKSASPQVRSSVSNSLVNARTNIRAGEALPQSLTRDVQDPPAVPRLEWIRREAAPQDALAFAASIPNGIRTATAAIFTLGGAVERSD
nr:hypothetical protein [uncultured Limnobacter sp.]